MTTYNSYEEAKIANPESEIVTAGSKWSGSEEFKGKFEVLNSDPDEAHILSGECWVKCNPADHCMTVERFLADGHKFVEGDCYVDLYGDAQCAGDDFPPLELNKPCQDDGERFILRAAALEEKPKRVKVSYVNANFSKEWKAVRYYNEVGELFVVDCNGNYTNVNDISGSWYEVVCKNYDSLFIQIETEIDERQEFIERAEELIDISKIAEYSLGKMYDAGCRFAD
ncbi:lipocalin family protein [Vibrio phage 1.177.O._10N.286.45.E10]|nr:lipocalin family protein [Vibrio phage 1.177.O._10N.286.45.E10]